jgi:hypothetical protein
MFDVLPDQDIPELTITLKGKNCSEGILKQS